MKLILIYFLFFLKTISTLKFYQNYKCTNGFCISFKHSILFQEYLKYCYLEYKERINFTINDFFLHELKKNKYYHKLKLDFLSQQTELVEITHSDLDYLVDVRTLVNLKSYFIQRTNLSKLEDHHLIPDIQKLQEVDLYSNNITKIKRLDFDSNFLTLLDFRNINASSIEEIYFEYNNISDNFVINFCDNYLETFPKIQGNLRRVNNYIIGVQWNPNLLYNKTLKLSDSNITIVNFVISYYNFDQNNISDTFSALLKSGTLVNIDISGCFSKDDTNETNFISDQYKLEVNHRRELSYEVVNTYLKDFFSKEKQYQLMENAIYDIYKCKSYVVATKNTLNSTKEITKKSEIEKNSTIVNKNTTHITKIIEKILQNASNISNRSTDDYNIAIKHYHKLEMTLRNRFLDYMIENKDVLFVFFTSVFLILLFLFFSFHFIFEKLAKQMKK
ncbi:unnamed protein product [Brachionus calyciflorus]|uniref:Uncharacterized protein n=1 Tax=Brachionus calyciflorus TaxID=104777 RepID=A0A813NCG9_9BILA|nr:unnamed protein product [Brachionus calyciflorus]